MREFQVRSMEDIGIGVPVSLPLPIDPRLFGEVVEHAAVTRGEGLRLARDAISQDQGATLRVMLMLVKVLVIPRTEEALAASSLKDAKIDCKAGCNACCHQSVEVSVPEAILVALQVADPADPRRANILETADRTAGLDVVKRIQTGLPCPLLVEGKCSVYGNRPLLCRATFSSCAQRCNDELAGKGEGTGGASVYPLPQFVALADKDALRGICKDLGLQYDNVELAQTVAAILRDPAKVMRWAAGERVFEPIIGFATPPEQPKLGRRAQAELYGRSN